MYAYGMHHEEPIPDYSFLNEEAAKKSRVPKLPSGNSKMSRIVIVCSGFILMIVFLAVLFNFLGRGSRQTQARMFSLAAEQQEIIRVSDIGVQEARTTKVKTFANNTNLNMQSTQSQLTEIVKTYASAPKPADLKAKLNEKTDELFEVAKQNNRFDEVFSAQLTDQLLAYQKSLRAAKNSVDTADKETLEELAKQIDGLLAGIVNEQN